MLVLLGGLSAVLCFGLFSFPPVDLLLMTCDGVIFCQGALIRGGVVTCCHNWPNSCWMVPKVRPYDPFLGEKGLVLLISGRCICIWIILFWILSSRFFCYFFLCPICVFGALCHSKSLHGKVIARSLMKCQVTVLIAQQHFFFFRKFCLLSKFSVSAFFPQFKMFLVKCAFSLIAIYFFHVVFGQILFLFSPPFLLV